MLWRRRERNYDWSGLEEAQVGRLGRGGGLKNSGIGMGEDKEMENVRVSVLERQCGGLEPLLTCSIELVYEVQVFAPAVRECSGFGAFAGDGFCGWCSVNGLLRGLRGVWRWNATQVTVV